MTALGTATVVRGDARRLPLPDDSVDLVVTSPPYFALRSYEDAGEHYDGQIGSEPSPQEFLDALIAVTRECARVLKPSGSMWVNLGDKYSDKPRRESSTSMAPRKSLLGLPWRYAIRCVDELGLILRQEIIWDKPNGLPESVTDRARRSHEQWFHFTLQPRYYSSVDEIREEHVRTWGANNGGTRPARAGAGSQYDGLDSSAPNPLGKLPGSVWTIATEPLKVPAHLGVDHFAAFPTEWPKRIIQGWSPAGVCIECGEGRRPRTESCACNEPIGSPTGSVNAVDPSLSTGRAGFNRPRGEREGRRVITRWEQRHEAAQLRDSPHRDAMATEAGPAFSHYVRTDTTGARPIPEALRIAWRERGWLTPAPPFVPPATTPGVVLDPFGGTGTTAMVAKALGRHGMTVDMSADYCRLAEWRTNDRDQLAKVLGVGKADQQPVDQMDLLTLILEGDPA